MYMCLFDGDSKIGDSKPTLSQNCLTDTVFQSCITEILK